MSVKTRISEVIATFSTLLPHTIDCLSQELATSYGIAKAKGAAGADSLLGKSAKSGGFIMVDGEKVPMDGTPAMRIYSACCLLREAVKKIESEKGAFNFAVVELPKLECPGLDRAFAVKKEAKVEVDAAANHVGEQ